MYMQSILIVIFYTYVSYIIVTVYIRIGTLKNRILCIIIIAIKYASRYYTHAYCCLNYKPFINNNLNKINNNIKINNSKLFKFNIPN